MNFMNRRMFAEAGPVVADTNPYFYMTPQGETKYLDEKKLLPVLRNTDIMALEALIQNPDVTYSPAAQEVFRQVVGERRSNYSSLEPSLFKFGESLPDSVTGLSAVRGIGGFAGDFAAQVGEGAYNAGRSLLSGFRERSYGDPEFSSQDVIPSERFPNDPNTITGRPGNDEGFLSGFNRPGMLRQGFTNPELGSILQRATGDVADFTEELKAIDGSGAITDQPSVIEELPTLTEELPTFTPTTSGESIGQLYEPGSVGRLEQDQRRLAYEASLIGVDEFGDPIEKPGIDDEITNLIKELTPAEIKVDINKTEADSLLETQEKFSPKFDMPKVDLNKVDTTITEDFDTAKPPRPPKETSGLFGSDRFLDFIRNVGGELSRTGQMGEGLASGAAKAAEERAARDLLEAQEQKKFDRELEIAGAVARAKADADNKPDIMKVKDIVVFNNDIKTDITDFKGGLAGVGFVDYAIEIIEDALDQGKPVGGFPGLIARAIDKAGAFVGMSKEFDSLSADSKVAALTEVVKQKNLQAILGESGRTISDKDRIIIEKVFGDLSAFESNTSVLGKLRESRRGLAESNNTRYENIQTNSEFLRLQGTYGQDFYTKMLPSLESILGINPYASQADTARARFGEQAGVGGADSQPIKDIDYK